MSPRATGGSGLVRPQLIVPAYFHPSTHPDEWAWLAERAAQIRMIVLNLASGPGAQPDAAFLPVLERLRSAGVTVAGYVDTNYGHRPVYDAMADLTRFAWAGTRSAERSSIGPPWPPRTSAITRTWPAGCGIRACPWWRSTTAPTRSRRTPRTRRPARHVRGSLDRLPGADRAALGAGAASRAVFSPAALGAGLVVR